VLLISSLLQRELSSMEDDYFRNRVVSALRWQFGRHPYEERLVKDTAPEVSYVEEEIELMKIRNACLAARAYAIAEGLTILNAYRDRYQLDLAQITKLWGHGSIIRSALMQKFADVLEEDGKLELDADIVEPKLESLSSDLFYFLRINFPELELGEIQNFIHNFSHVNISTCRGGFAYLLISSVFGKIEL